VDNADLQRPDSYTTFNEEWLERNELKPESYCLVVPKCIMCIATRSFYTIKKPKKKQAENPACPFHYLKNYDHFLYLTNLSVPSKSMLLFEERFLTVKIIAAR
jgi:hypothetical protein